MKTVIRVAVFRPLEEVSFEVIGNDLASLQKLVGGYIENVCISPVFSLVCNEEGKLMEEMLPNRILSTSVGDDVVMGTFMVTRSAGGNYIGIRDIDEAKLAKWKPGTNWLVS